MHGLDISSPNYLYANYYQPTDYRVLDEVFERLTVPYEEYTFTDYGSGKGLVLLRAAAYPFKKVIGVEFARELHEIAQQNLRRFPAELVRTEVELVYGDAFEFTPPEGNLVLYFFESFEAPLTRKLIARIEQLSRGRNVMVVCAWAKNPAIRTESIWNAQAFLEKVHAGDGWAIYRAAD